MTALNKAQLLTSFIGQPVITAADVQNLVDSVAPSFGSYYISAPTATTGMGVNVWTKAEGTTTEQSSDRFAHTNNRLTYTGTPSVHAHIAVSVSFTTTGDGNIVSIGLAKNDLLLPGDVLREVGQGSAVGSTALHGDTMLDTGDYLEIWIKTNQVTAGRAVTLEAAYLFALGMLV